MRKLLTVLAVVFVVAFAGSLFAQSIVVAPSSATGKGPGTVTQVCVNVEDVSDLVGFDIYVDYDQNVVKLEKVSSLSWCDFLVSNGASLATYGVVLNEDGLTGLGAPMALDYGVYAWAGVTWSTIDQLADGDGCLFCLDFTIQGSGSTIIEILTASGLDSTSGSISYAKTDGYITQPYEDNPPTVDATGAAGTIGYGTGSYAFYVWVDDGPQADPDTSWVVGAEYFLGSDPGEGNGTAMTPADGAWNSTVEQAYGVIDTSAWLPGVHTVYVRGRDAWGNWSAVESFDVLVAAPGISVQPSSVDFGYQTVCHPTSATLTVINTGDADLYISMYGISGPDASDFAISGFNVPTTLEPGDSFDFAVTFHAPYAGAKAATFTVYSNAYEASEFQVPLSGIAALPSITVEPPDELDFGQAFPGACKPMNIIIGNTGYGDLYITNIYSDNPYFTDIYPTDAVVASGATISVMIAFCPEQIGPTTGTLTIVSNDPSGSYVLGLAGECVLPGIGVSETSHDFGDCRVNSTNIWYFDIENTGTGELDFEIDSDNDAFSVFPTSGTVLPGTPSTIEVEFVPGMLGPISGLLTITHNVPETPDITIDLTGNGVASAVEFIPADAVEGHDFGNVLVCTKAQWQFTLKNATSATATLNYEFSTDIPGTFDVLPTVGTLGIGSESVISVWFHPTKVGPTTGTLILHSPDADFGDDVLIDLSGFGIAPDIDVIGSHTFPDTRYATIGVGETKPFPIRFAPSTVGTISGVITIFSNDPDEPTVAVQMVGVGLHSPEIGLPDIEVRSNFGVLRVGETTQGTIEISNIGTADLMITSVQITDNTESFSIESATTGTMSTTTEGWSLGPGEALFVTIEFHPVAIGPTTGTLTIYSNDPVYPVYGVTLTGEGTAAPNIVVSPTSLDYGVVLVGDAIDRTFEIQNTSELVPLIVSGIESSTAEFTVISPTEFPVTVSTVSPITVTVEFSPSTVGTVSGVVTVSSDDPETPQVDVSVFGIGYEDTVPPAAIADLQAETGATTAGIILSWTAPADDGTDATTGPCASYEIRFSEEGPITTEQEYASASVLENSIVPATPGTQEVHEFSMPEEGVEYYFSIRSRDAAGNESALSNSPSAVSLAVELVSFKAAAGDGRVVLTWETASEIDNLGFNVMRSTDASGKFVKINPTMIPGAGTTAQPSFYTYTDENVQNGVTYLYYLVAVDFSGVESNSDIVAATPNTGRTTSLLIDISTNRPRFTVGDELVVSISLANIGQTAEVDARVWATLPTGRNFVLVSADGTFVDAGLAVMGEIMHYRFTRRDAIGRYSIVCLITDSLSQDIISYSVTSFRLSPEAVIMPPEMIEQSVVTGNAGGQWVEFKGSSDVAPIAP